MAHVPSLDLLKATHSFPCVYVVKAIGIVEQNFQARVVAAVRDELELTQDPTFQVRTTPDGKHVAVTLELKVATAESIIKLYHRVLAVPGLVMVF